MTLLAHRSLASTMPSTAPLPLSLPPFFTFLFDCPVSTFHFSLFTIHS